MKNRQKVIVMLLGVLVAQTVVHADPIWQEDFATAPSVRADNWAVLGGDYSNSSHREINFGEWVTAEVWTGNGTIVDGRLKIASGAGRTSGTGIILDPALFGTAGQQYKLTFDVVVSNIAEGTNLIFADVFAGSNYNLEPDSTAENRIVLKTAYYNGLDRTEIKLVNANSPAIVDLLGGTGFLENGTYLSQEVVFTYDGISAIALMFGSTGGAVGQVDNMTIEVIPEPATLGLISLIGAAILCVRRCFLV